MVIGCILGGGDATRFGGIDKLALQIEGSSICQRLLAALAPVVDEVVVATGAAGRARLDSVPSHVRIVHDAAPGLGPLAGLAAAFSQSSATAVVLVGGDMPFITTPVLRRLLAAYRAGHDGAAFSVNGRLEPLLAVYGRALLPHVSDLLARGSRRMSDVLEKSMGNVCVLTENDLASVDEHFRCLTNLNSAHDVARIRST
ncbi:MAG: molybdenum cofactor guanylyltransferase [Myxococcales bacterium]|nr:molybdenum cofactor guanylyltransferase [Myxococcales bacterium]